MEFINLSSRPDLVPLVAKWYFDEWGKLSSAITYQSVLEKLNATSSLEVIPLTRVGLENSRVVGAAQLKFQENKRYASDTHWVGGVYVPVEERGRGIGNRLVEEMIRTAKALGVKELYLQTEQLDGGLYPSCGFEILERGLYNGVDVAVMKRVL